MDSITPYKAKEIIRKELQAHGLAYSRLSARTISFTDLARGSCLFVKIHGWEPDPWYGVLQRLAKANGFCLEATCAD